MKELYNAPEVEILCFAPMEAIAEEGWGWSTWGAKHGGTETTLESIEIPETNPDDGEG